MKQCPYCNAQIDDNSRFCSECGKEITQANVCPHCGASVGEGDAFCQSCGKSLNKPSSGVESKSGFKKYLTYVIGAVIVLGVIGYFASSDGGKDTISTVSDSLLVEGNGTDEIPNTPSNTSTKTNAFVGKVYKGSGTGEGLGIDMTITFINEKECLCLSDWYRAYSPNKEIKCPYDIKDNHVIVHVNDDGTKYDMNFEIADGGKKIGFTNSDRDFLTLELVDRNNAAVEAEEIESTDN